jgi:hypothetical protein
MNNNLGDVVRAGRGLGLVLGSCAPAGNVVAVRERGDGKGDTSGDTTRGGGGGGGGTGEEERSTERSGALKERPRVRGEVTCARGFVPRALLRISPADFRERGISTRGEPDPLGRETSFVFVFFSLTTAKKNKNNSPLLNRTALKLRKLKSTTRQLMMANH